MKTEINGFMKSICANLDALNIAWEEWDNDKIMERLPIYDLRSYAPAKRMDDHTRMMIERFDAESITSGDACGALPVAGMLISARNRGMRIRTLGMCNSGDITGDKSRVVGYGAWAVYAGSADMREDEKTNKSSGGCIGATEKLLADHGATMIDLARQSIWHGIKHGGPLRIDPASVSPALLQPGA